MPFWKRKGKKKAGAEANEPAGAESAGAPSDAAREPDDEGAALPQVEEKQEIESAEELEPVDEGGDTDALFGLLAAGSDRVSAACLVRFGYEMGSCSPLEELLGGTAGVDAAGFRALAAAGLVGAGAGTEAERALAMAALPLGSAPEAGANPARGEASLDEDEMLRMLREGASAADVLRAAHGREDVDAELKWLKEVAAAAGVPTDNPSLLRELILP